MRRILFGLGVSLTLFAQSGVPRIQDVKSIYVDTFGTGEDADLFKGKLVARLGKERGIELAKTADAADAVLSGSVLEEKKGNYGVVRGVTSYEASATVRLVNKDQKVLWMENAANRPYAESASGSLADKVVRDLMKEMRRK